MSAADDVIAAARRARKARCAERDRAWREAALAAYRARGGGGMCRVLDAMHDADKVIHARDARERRGMS